MIRRDFVTRDERNIFFTCMVTATHGSPEYQRHTYDHLQPGNVAAYAKDLN